MNNQPKKTTLITVGLWALWSISGFAADSVEFHVSTIGRDDHPGTITKPFATLERARDAIRETGLAGKTDCAVWIHDGIHRRRNAFTLEAMDSGTYQHPVLYRANGKHARVIGGNVVNAEAFTLVKSPETLARLSESARGKVYELDLESSGIKRAQAYPDRFTDNGGLFELFFDNQRMPIATYPNHDGSMTIKRVVINGGGQEKPGNWRDYYDGTADAKRALESGLGPRPGVFQYQPKHAAAHAKWAKVLDRGVWVKGYWRVVWQNETVRVAAIDSELQTVTLAVPVSSGIGNKYHRPEGSGSEIYWVMNLLEAVDTPGEWAVDFQDQKLYFYPPQPLEDNDILISDADQPMIKLNGASNVELRGLTIEGTLGDGIHISSGESNTIRGCVVRNVAKYGIVVEGGSKHTIKSCDLHNIGAGGVWLSGGDSNVNPRIPAQHRVENCDIHHFGEIERVYAPGINVGFRGGGGGSKVVDAVGMIVRNNAIHHCPHAGVLFNSLDNVFEFNEVFQFALISNDMGAFYSYARPLGIGNNTFRYNFMHSSPEGDGVYFDNVAHHDRVYSNIAYRLGPSDLTKPAKRGCGFLIKNKTNNPVNISDNLAIDCKTGFWVNAGQGSTIEGNVAIACGNSQGAGKLKTLDRDPELINLNTINQLLKESQSFEFSAGQFKNISIDEIGLYEDEHRKTLPKYRQQLDGWSPSVTAPGYEILDRD